ncbi:helix-turn-helix domain-containing protein [Actinomycetospora endophytica]|uniref:Helix-turn-helix domain-containing protein n=1 Tax=Actinomycetospora endophytica TaxID=2291215 RepID=A0ABS8PKQ5_9PSEU|nr:helix-turn-helix domain-containing protein [Actinomycetospora endophytica]MCD2197559.1 helix-turn-helix domain-containing protein [Actinomycetospora endophytica]
MGVWDIAALPPREQFGYWHEVICQAFVPLTPHRTLDEEGFSARVETRPLAGLNRARLRARPQRTDHGPREVARTDDDHYFVNLQLAGRCITTVRGETSVVERGQFVVVDTTEPYFFHLDEPWQMLSYRLPHAALTDALHGRRPALGRPVDGTGVGSVVTALMTALWPLGTTTPGAADLTDSFAAAVAAATAEGRRDAGPDEQRGVTRAAVLAYVERHLGDRDLTVHGVSRRFAISPRTLHNLFADTDGTFAATVRRLRLERSAARLADPADTATVTAVAAAHGFDDPTSFSRAFRRRFGVSPRDVAT